jgi:hypothetical protein
MKEHEVVKNAIREHKDEIQLIQVGINGAIASLIYSEFLRNFKQVHSPTLKIFIPEIKSVRELLDLGSEFSNELSDNMIARMVENELFAKYLSVPELSLFSEENIDSLKSLFELYILPNCARSIPVVIANKFNLGNQDNQLFYESGDIDLFDRKFPSNDHIDFTIDQAVLQILMLTPSVEKNIEPCERAQGLAFPSDIHEVISVSNSNAISVIHFNKSILTNEVIKDIFSFVTNTTFEFDILNGNYKVTSSPFNTVIRTKLK